jgi:hypothetical protein
MDRTATVTAGMDPIGWHQAAELRAMAAYASLAMQNSGAVPFGQPTYDACMYGTPLTGMPGYAVPFMPGVPPLNATPLSEVPAAPEIVWEDNETQPKPRYSYRPAYRYLGPTYHVMNFPSVYKISGGTLACHADFRGNGWCCTMKRLG